MGLIHRTLYMIFFACMMSFIIIDMLFNTPLAMSSDRKIHTREQMILAKQLISNKSHLCDSTKHHKVIIVVKSVATSSGKYYKRRMFTRESLSRKAKQFNISVLYAIGLSENDQVQQKLLNEDKIYDDILQFNFTDTYYNLTLKTMGVLFWYNRYCLNSSSYLYYIDDNVLLNVPALMKYLNNSNRRNDTLKGIIFKQKYPFATEKWSMSIEDYPNKTYSNYIMGTATLFPSKIIPKLIESSIKILPTLFLDDIFISDIVAHHTSVKQQQLDDTLNCSQTIQLSKNIFILECNQNRMVVWTKYLIEKKQTNNNSFQLIEIANNINTNMILSDRSRIQNHYSFLREYRVIALSLILFLFSTIRLIWKAIYTRFNHQEYICRV
ncbi:unnamed protein product [Didymodactylos carnosus]|uniref:Hexosyltransferase n=1 Tax=Didymodactylos carnosus TaxID=1234261 RepID=A0A814SZK1_9BILA|nr:unnamed protein product [Didymodactylos carnosus]CAF3917375.1 unnamed protein product [Didymodactylos carnosus]